MFAIGQNCLDQSGMIENGIARFDIAQKIDQRDLVGLRARERAHDEVEIGGGKARPTIRPDHRELVMPNSRVYGKPNRRINCEAFGCVRAFVDVSSQIDSGSLARADFSFVFRDAGRERVDVPAKLRLALPRHLEPALAA